MRQFKTIIEKSFEENYSSDEVPNQQDYVAKYKSMKDWLHENCYRFIGAATSAEDGSFFTDHGPEHFDEVLKYAGQLLGINEKSQKCELKTYEVFLLLAGVLVHDAGNVRGRLNHESQAMAILKEMGTSIFNWPFERKIIAEIAASHGGKVKDSKDTINTRIKNRSTDFLSITFRPMLIAAIVRFADEICENSGRTSNYLINNQAIPKPSEVFHKYAASITGCTVDLESRRVNVNYSVSSPDISIRFGKGDKEVFLVDEIFERIEKMYQELMYCSRFFDGVIKVDSIRAKITVYDNEDYEEEITNLTIASNEGYPSSMLDLKTRYPDWVEGRLAESLKEEASK